MATRFLLASSFTAALAFAATTPAMAQDEDPLPVVPETIQKLYDCRSVADPMQRLACFDAQVAELAQKQESEDILFADKEQLREARRGLFGLSLPRIRLFDGSSNDDDFSEITTTVKQAVSIGEGKWGLVLEDGARWVQNDNTILYRDIEPGTPITISKGALTSFNAKIGNRKSIKVKRVQ